MRGDPSCFWMTPRNRATRSYRTTIKFRFSPLAMFCWGILFTLLVNIWWIILLLVVLNLIDRHRFREYITKHPPAPSPIPGLFPSPALLARAGLVLVPPYAVPGDRGPLRGRRRFRGRRRPAGPRWDRRRAGERLHRPRAGCGAAGLGIPGETPRKRSAGSTAASGERGAAFGTWGGNGCTCSRTKSAACSVGGACSPLSPFFLDTLGRSFFVPRVFAPALKRQPHRLEILSRTGGVFRPFLAFSLTPPECSPPVQAGGKIPFTATQRLILVPMLWNFSS